METSQNNKIIRETDFKTTVVIFRVSLEDLLQEVVRTFRVIITLLKNRWLIFIIQLLMPKSYQEFCRGGR